LSASVYCPAPGSANFSVWDASISPRDLPSIGGGAGVPVVFAPNTAGELSALIVLSCSDTGPGGTLYPRAYILCSGRGVPACP
jgi:hypothetical protein